MAEIAASMVMDLRQRTGLGMMECKKALTEAAGDLAKAEELLRIKSGAKASKAASRIAAEGVIGLYVAPDAKTAAMVEVNCETDFVAKNDDFRAFAAEVAQIIARDNPADRRRARRASRLPPAKPSRPAARRSCRRSARTCRCAASRERSPRAGSLPTCTAAGSASSWMSPAGRTRWARILRCTSPRASRWRVSRDGVPADVIERERKIKAAQAAESGKPANIVEKMVEGGVAKFIAEVTLLGQPFVKGDGKQTVGELVKSQGAVVHDFVLFVVGEGIEKKKDDFAAEVAAMTKA